MNLKLDNLKLKIKGYIDKLRVLPEKQKKIILWATVVVLGLIMGYFWFKSVIYRLNNLEQINLNIELPSNSDNNGLENNQNLENNQVQ